MRAADRTTRDLLVTRLLEPVRRCFTPKGARKLLKLRADRQMQARAEELAEKCNEGQLTPAEREEYESYISASNFIAILQAQARAFLARPNKS